MFLGWILLVRENLSGNKRLWEVGVAEASAAAISTRSKTYPVSGTEDHTTRIRIAHLRYCVRHVKFCASSVVPLPLYSATCGYGQSGRVRSTLPSFHRDATIRSDGMLALKIQSFG